MYHPMQMHLHTCHQPGGSMEGHIYNAQKLGMQYIRFTDHDTRTGRKECPVTCFDFSKGELEYNDCKHGTVALDLFGDPDYRFENGALSIHQSNAVLPEKPQSESYQIGLNSIRRIAQHYGGSVAVEENGAAFSITIILSQI